jgi:hypothetical protein
MAASDNKYDSFLFRASWWQSLKNLPNDCRSEVYDAVCMYVFENKEPAFDPMSATSMAVRFIITDLEYDKQKYADVSEKRAAAGRRGGQAKAANVANAKKEQQETESERQNVANVANANFANNRIEENRIEQNSSNNNDNNSSFSFPADAEKKEKIIFDFSLVLLSEGRPNAYNEAREAYGYNDATGWESEKTDTAGNVTKKKIRNKLAWIEAGWKRHNEQVFAPAHGQILADILRQTGMRPENADVINAFRGFRFEGDETNIAFLYTRKTAWQKFAAAITANDSVNKTVFGELTKVFPKVKQLHFTTY